MTDTLSLKMKRTVAAPEKNKVTKKAKTFAKLSVNYTGIRDSETLVGCNYNQTDGVEMKVRAALPYYPIDECPPNVVRDQLKSLEFFSKMTFEERTKWLNDNRKSYKSAVENHLQDPHNSLSVKFTKIQCKHFIEKLGEEVIASLIAKEEYIPMREVYDLFKPKDKVTKANRHTLVFRPENFKVKPAQAKRASFQSGHVFRLFANQPFSHTKEEAKVTIDVEKESICVVSDFLSEKTCILYTEKPPALEKSCLIEEAAKLLSESERAEMPLIEAIIKPFQPSLLKSLLQKIIRTRCAAIIQDQVEYSVKPFLLVSLSLLMLHPGSYNLNKQRFVSGLESALKRLAIIICEDSYIKDSSTLTLLLAGALVRQRDRSWAPSMNHVTRIFEAALEALESRRMFEYETGTPYYVGALFNDAKRPPTDFVFNAIILEKLGSMTGDINLFGYLAVLGQVIIDRPAKPSRIVMPLVHCIDQHSYTSIAHFMPFDENAHHDPVAPFKALFSQLWQNVGSKNGRRDDFDENEPFVKEVRMAQNLIYCQRFKEKLDLTEEATDERYEFSHKIDVSWIAGLVGPISVKLASGTKTIVVIRVDDVMAMSTIRNPKNARSGSANDIAVDLTAEEKEESIEVAKKLLRAGYPLTHVPGALEQFKGARVRLVDQDVASDAEKKYVIQLKDGQDEIDWDDAIAIKASIPVFIYDGDGENDRAQDWLSTAVSVKSSSIAHSAFEIFSKILDRYPLGVIKRLLMYLSNYRPSIKLYDISRDGSATKLDVSLSDIGVNHILCAICTLFPACLELNLCGDFSVKYGPLLWSIRERIKERVDEASIRVDNGNQAEYWAEIPGDPNHALFDHQQDSVNEMIKKNQRNKRGHELFQTVGTGKTAILMSFMQYLVKNRRMCTYCVYSSPPNATVNAKSEFDRFGIPYVDMVTQSTKPKKDGKYKDAELVPFVINIIAHDQMRRDAVHAQLKHHAADMLFIVDEFHLATSTTTIRSSIALEISKNAFEFVALTGTIIRNDNPSDLIQWLEQIVEFYVNCHNYLVAFGALVSRKVNTGVHVKLKEIMCEMSADEEVVYNKTVPARLGGNAEMFNFRAAIKLCYDAVNREMVHQIKHHVLKKKEIVFVLAQNNAHQESLRDQIIEASKGKIREKHIFLIDKENSIVLKPETKTKIKVVITTLLRVTGYTLTKCHTSIGSVYPSNESSRSQYEGRTNRIGQPEKEVKIITIHCGVLSYMNEHYKRSRSFSEALKEFAAHTGLDYRALISDIS